jgi:hypothetical protein
VKVLLVPRIQGRMVFNPAAKLVPPLLFSIYC